MWTHDELERLTEAFFEHGGSIKQAPVGAWKQGQIDFMEREHLGLDLVGLSRDTTFPIKVFTQWGPSSSLYHPRTKIHRKKPSTGVRQSKISKHRFWILIF